MVKPCSDYRVHVHYSTLQVIKNTDKKKIHQEKYNITRTRLLPLELQWRLAIANGQLCFIYFQDLQPSSSETDPLSLSQVHKHMVRSPPPVFWPRSPRSSVFNFINNEVSSKKEFICFYNSKYPVSWRTKAIHLDIMTKIQWVKVNNNYFYYIFCIFIKTFPRLV